MGGFQSSDPDGMETQMALPTSPSTFDVSPESKPQQPQHRSPKKMKTLSSGVVPIYLGGKSKPDGELLILLLRCFNYWDFPKGGLNPGETPLDAAIRELEEETTLEKVDFPWGQNYRETPVYADGKVARYYIGEVYRTDVGLPINPLLGRPEHHEFRWVTVREAYQLLNARVRPILDWVLQTIEQRK